MAEFLEQAGEFGVGGCFVDVLEHPAEEIHQFAAGGVQAGEILHVAPLVAVEGGAEFEQDQALAANEADFEILSIFPGDEFLPEPRRELGEVDAMERGGSIEPIQIESELFRDFGGSLLHRIRQWIGADDVALPFAYCHHVHILGLAGTDLLNEQGATTPDDQPNRTRFS